MAVRPVEFTGMIQNTHEVSANRTNDMHRPMNEQQQMAMQTAQQAAVSTTQVSESQQSETDSFDASDGDGSGYEGNQNRKKKEKEKKNIVSDGAVIKKDGRTSFEVTV